MPLPEPARNKEGHFELMRDNEDVWIIDVDAWFIAAIITLMNTTLG